MPHALLDSIIFLTSFKLCTIINVFMLRKRHTVVCTTEALHLYNMDTQCLLQVTIIRGSGITAILSIVHGRTLHSAYEKRKTLVPAPSTAVTNLEAIEHHSGLSSLLPRPDWSVRVDTDSRTVASSNCTVVVCRNSYYVYYW